MEHRIQAVSWNITRLCNLKCSHCYLPAGLVDAEEFPDGTFGKGELTTKQCFRVIDEIAEMNPHILLILTGGEPLLRADIFQVSKYASGKGFLVVLGTNGVLLNDDKVRLMVENGITGAGISIDSIDPRSHDQFRGLNGAWKATMSGIDALKRANLDFLVQTSVTRWNYDQISKIVEYSEGMGAKVFNLYFLVTTGRGKTVMDISSKQYEEMMSTLFELQAQYRGRMLIQAKCAPHYKRVIYEQATDSPFLQAYPGGTCPCGIHYCRISPEGELTPCPYLPESVGNLKEKNFHDLWNDSQLFAELRDRSLLKGKCGDCEFREVCGGCRARAYAQTGDYLEADPSCEYQPGRYGGQIVQFDNQTPFAAEPNFDLLWTQDARERLDRVPSFAKGMVIKSVERYAKENGSREVTPEMMKAVKENFFRTGIPSFKPKLN